MADESPMTLAEAAGELGVSLATLEADAVEGRLEARRFETSWLTSRSAVERYRTIFADASIEAQPTDEPKTDMDAVGDDGQVFGG